MAIALDETAPHEDRLADSGRPRAAAVAAHTRSHVPAPADRHSLAAHLERVGEAAAQASRVLFDARLDGLVARLSGIENWQLQPVSRDDAAPPVEEPGRIVLAHVAGTMSIDVDLRSYPALQILASAEPVSPAEGSANAGAAQALRQSIAAALLAPLVETLLSAGIGTWRVAEVRRLDPDAPAASRADAADRADALLAHVALTAGGRHHTAHVQASPAILALLERRIASLHEHAAPSTSGAHASTPNLAVRSPSLPAWRIPGRITIGARRIAIAALEALRPGDVLLRTLPHATETALGLGHPFRAHAAWGTPGLTRLNVAVQIDDNRLAILEDPIMNDEAQYPDDGSPPLTVDLQGDPIEIGELDLPVQFELDSVALPLAQLSSLRPGHVIELDTPVADAQIRLVAHGQTIGYGELIAVAEHLGIRIVRMAHGDASVR
ncbi:type III secretion system cytoplasmic ring protein SctQ [Paraburkholderia sp. BCC1886]|uniref:type III secretion system cytoplasmic ring protein SctQ n=1 Tax=Paraburkholderia sp. BCC1886 TaxID=2562670 RepID=UPI0011820273|nr:type III secretion system cytoplasmic ring protein SctQ [Paraburkholderia sp. BCC1886]